MRAEIILACRRELPANLRRTVQNIMATKGADDRLTVVMDGDHGDIGYSLPSVNVVKYHDVPRGPGRHRHLAIMDSKADFVALVDGHMTFPSGWLDAICGHLEGNNQDVTCCHMVGLDHQWRPIPSEGVYDGCHLELCLPEEARKNWWINSVWNKTPLKSGVVGSIMGACYGLTPAFYRAMGQPLAILGAWGGDEEILSAAAWLMGGRCYLLPPTCGHIWAAPRLRPPDIDYRERWEMWANHYAILAALPLSPAENDAMRRHLDRGNDRITRVAEVLAVRSDAIDRARLALSKPKRSWNDLKTIGIVQKHGEIERQIEDIPTIKTNKMRRKAAKKA